MSDERRKSRPRLIAHLCFHSAIHQGKVTRKKKKSAILSIAPLGLGTIVRQAESCTQFSYSGNMNDHSLSQPCLWIVVRCEHFRPSTSLLPTLLKSLFYASKCHRAERKMFYENESNAIFSSTSPFIKCSAANRSVRINGTSVLDQLDPTGPEK